MLATNTHDSSPASHSHSLTTLRTFLNHATSFSKPLAPAPAPAPPCVGACASRAAASSSSSEPLKILSRASRGSRCLFLGSMPETALRMIWGCGGRSWSACSPLCSARTQRRDPTTEKRPVSKPAADKVRARSGFGTGKPCRSVASVSAFPPCRPSFTARVEYAATRSLSSAQQHGACSNKGLSAPLADRTPSDSSPALAFRPPPPARSNSPHPPSSPSSSQSAPPSARP